MTWRNYLGFLEPPGNSRIPEDMDLAKSNYGWGYHFTSNHCQVASVDSDLTYTFFLFSLETTEFLKAKHFSPLSSPLKAALLQKDPSNGLFLLGHVR